MNESRKQSSEDGKRKRFGSGPGRIEPSIEAPAVPSIKASTSLVKPNTYRSKGMLALLGLGVGWYNLMREIGEAKRVKAYVELTLLGERRAELLMKFDTVIEDMKHTGEFDPDQFIPSESQIEDCQGIEADNRERHSKAK